MKLVESDVPDHPTGEAPKPSPPRRRVAVSLIFTVSVLVATVVIIYTVFPKRNNEILAIAIDHHREPAELELDGPSRPELTAWSIGLHGRAIPWPKLGSDVEVEGAYALRIFRRPVSLVRMKVAGQPVTLMALRARDTLPRRRKSIDDDLIAQSWRVKKWTFVAVGRRDMVDAWRPVVGAK